MNFLNFSMNRICRLIDNTRMAKPEDSFDLNSSPSNKNKIYHQLLPDAAFQSGNVPLGMIAFFEIGAALLALVSIVFLLSMPAVILIPVAATLAVLALLLILDGLSTPVYRFTLPFIKGYQQEKAFSELD